MLLLRTYTLRGGDTAFGVKIREADPPHPGMAASVLVSTHYFHTRYEFAKFKLRSATGPKADQCRRIMAHCNEVYLRAIGCRP